MPDTTGSECFGKGRGSHVGQKHFEKAEKESPESLCYTSMPQSVSGDSGVDRTTTKRVDERKMNDLTKYVMQQNSSIGRLVRSNGVEMGRPHGKHGCRHTSKESGRKR